MPLAGSGSSARIHLTSALCSRACDRASTWDAASTCRRARRCWPATGTPLAEGPDRTSPIPSVAEQIVGTLGPIPAAQRSLYADEGYPRDAKVGQDGLERIFENLLAGTPGGTLLAGRRVLARSKPLSGKSVTTTIVPSLERATVAALGGQYAGMTVMNPRTGALEAVAGIAWSSVQPPGSTMKIITASAALTAGIVNLGTTFPIQTSADIDGYSLQNAGGEACGGTLLNAFAVSCNSVFAPWEPSSGAPVWSPWPRSSASNQVPSIPGALESTIPPADQIGDALAVGSSAIGQGMVQASALEMADVAATIAMGGRRPIPTLQAHQKPQFVRVISPTVAHEVEKMMVAVVRFGTGTRGRGSPGSPWPARRQADQAELTNTAAPGQSTAQNTDAWFVGYAPVGHPKGRGRGAIPQSGCRRGGGRPTGPRRVIESALGMGLRDRRGVAWTIAPTRRFVRTTALKDGERDGRGVATRFRHIQPFAGPASSAERRPQYLGSTSLPVGKDMEFVPPTSSPGLAGWPARPWEPAAD